MLTVSTRLQRTTDGEFGSIESTVALDPPHDVGRASTASRSRGRTSAAMYMV